MKKLLTAIVKQLITLYCKTWRYKFHGKVKFTDRTVLGTPSVVVLWHDQLLPLTFSWCGKDIGTIASQSKDGDIITELLHKWGYTVARGSSTRGGARALIGGKKILSGGMDLAITVDGPRGPRHVVKSGAIVIAKMVNAPLQPVLMSCKHYIRFKSWDKFILPLPFVRVDVYFPPHVILSQDNSDEAVENDRQMLEQMMLEYTSAFSHYFV